jgi:hypothetical protein
VDAIATNLGVVLEQVHALIGAALAPSSQLRVAYVDVNLAIAIDGSVGLLGTAVGTNSHGALTLRLQL